MQYREISPHIGRNREISREISLQQEYFYLEREIGRWPLKSGVSRSYRLTWNLCYLDQLCKKQLLKLSKCFYFFIYMTWKCLIWPQKIQKTENNPPLQLGTGEYGMVCLVEPVCNYILISADCRFIYDSSTFISHRKGTRYTFILHEKHGTRQDLF